MIPPYIMRFFLLLASLLFVVPKLGFQVNKVRIVDA